MKNPKELKKLADDLHHYRELLGKTADAVLDQGISSYPIFVLHHQDIALGILLVQGDGEKMPWTVNVTTLEELATKNIVSMEKVDNFRQVYKDPQDYFCLFILDGEQADFVFLPRD